MSNILLPLTQILNGLSMLWISGPYFDHESEKLWIMLDWLVWLVFVTSFMVVLLLCNWLFCSYCICVMRIDVGSLIQPKLGIEKWKTWWEVPRLTSCPYVLFFLHILAWKTTTFLLCLKTPKLLTVKFIISWFLYLLSVMGMFLLHVYYWNSSLSSNGSGQVEVARTGCIRTGWVMWVISSILE